MKNLNTFTTGSNKVSAAFHNYTMILTALLFLLLTSGCGSDMTRASRKLDRKEHHTKHHYNKIERLEKKLDNARIQYETAIKEEETARKNAEDKSKKRLNK